RPSDRSACSFGPPASRLETRPLPMCRLQASRGFPPHARRSFFERVHGLSILLVGLIIRPGAHMREAQLLEGAIDRVVRHRESELLIQPRDEIARPPAHHAMARRDRTLLYDAGEKGLVPGVELGRHSRRRDIDETVRSLLVEPDHPVPQSMPPIVAASSREAPSSTAAIANSRRACAASFARWSKRRTSPAVYAPRTGMAWPMANALSLPS